MVPIAPITLSCRLADFLWRESAATPSKRRKATTPAVIKTNAELLIYFQAIRRLSPSEFLNLIESKNIPQNDWLFATHCHLTQQRDRFLIVGIDTHCAGRKLRGLTSITALKEYLAQQNMRIYQSGVPKDRCL